MSVYCYAPREGEEGNSGLWNELSLPDVRLRNNGPCLGWPRMTMLAGIKQGYGQGQITEEKKGAALLWHGSSRAEIQP